MSGVRIWHLPHCLSGDGGRIGELRESVCRCSKGFVCWCMLVIRVCISGQTWNVALARGYVVWAWGTVGCGYRKWFFLCLVSVMLFCVCIAYWGPILIESGYYCSWDLLGVMYSVWSLVRRCMSCELCISLELWVCACVCFFWWGYVGEGFFLWQFSRVHGGLDSLISLFRVPISFVASWCLCLVDSECLFRRVWLCSQAAMH